jgi:two-component system, NtrC family, response regulator AtoC
VSAKVLVVDDDSDMTEMLTAGLEKLGLSVESRESGNEAFELLAKREFDVVVTDLNMRGINGLELCERIVANRPDIPVVVITAFGSLDTAIAAIRVGAYDFIPKPFDLDVLGIALRRAVQHRALRDEVKRLRHELGTERRSDHLQGKSVAIQKIDEMISRVCESTTTVLVTGESGTGKERVARALHERSSRRGGPFVTIDCAALPETLLESELFGHTSGAFTDARAARTGLLVQASGGTLFLDEIGELPLSLQPKLLRALQERKIRPVGSNTEVGFDVRIVAATNRDLETAVDEGRFREDLFYRVNVIHIEVPPLRSRGGDVLLLAQHFLAQHSASASGRPVAGFSPPVAERLLAYSWPGNVRELQNCIERAVAVARYEQLTVEDLPERIRSYRSNPIVVDSHNPADLLTMEEVEKRYMQRVLEAVGGNKTLAARVLGFDRRTLYRKLGRFPTTE